jgi:hypothetical protein
VADARDRVEALRRGGDDLDSIVRESAVELTLAELDAREGRLDAARSRAVAALAVVETELSNPPQVVALTVSSLARFDAAAGRIEDADAWLRYEQVAATLLWDMPVSARIAVSAAVVRLAAGEPEAAAELLGLGVALRGAEDTSDPAARRIADEARAALGPERFTAARARGAGLTRDRARSRTAEILGLPPAAGRDGSQERRR